MLVGIIGAAGTASAGEVYKNTGFAMDTVAVQTLYTSGEDITGEILQILEDLDDRLLSWTKEEAELYQINAAAGADTPISQEASALLEQVLQLSEDSNGALDPSIGRLIGLWDIDGENPQVPSGEAVKELCEASGWEKIALTGESICIPEGCSLNLGAEGKGIGCDAVMEYLRETLEVEALMLNLGGSSVMAYGEKPDGSPWQIALTDPRDTEGDYLGVVTLQADEFLSTSGDYEKYFIEDGVRYHHILDPATGYPARSGLISVTVVCRNGLAADGLSTACFVMGRERAEELLKKYDADALFVDKDAGVFMTEGMKTRFRLLKEGYTVKE